MYKTKKALTITCRDFSYSKCCCTQLTQGFFLLWFFFIFPDQKTKTARFRKNKTSVLLFILGEKIIQFKSLLLRFFYFVIPSCFCFQQLVLGVACFCFFFTWLTSIICFPCPEKLWPTKKKRTWAICCQCSWILSATVKQKKTTKQTTRSNRNFRFRFLFFALVLLFLSHYFFFGVSFLLTPLLATFFCFVVV